MSSLTDESAQYRKQLDLWIEKLGLPQYQPSESEVERILGFTRDDLRQRSSTQLAEDAVCLAQYALFLQQQANECQVFMKWASQVERKIFGNDRPKLNQWVKKAELRDGRIAYLARRIELIGQSISGLVRARYNEGSNR